MKYNNYLHWHFTKLRNIKINLLHEWRELNSEEKIIWMEVDEYDVSMFVVLNMIIFQQKNSEKVNTEIECPFCFSRDVCPLIFDPVVYTQNIQCIKVVYFAQRNAQPHTLVSFSVCEILFFGKLVKCTVC